MAMQEDQPQQPCSTDREKIKHMPACASKVRSHPAEAGMYIFWLSDCVELNTGCETFAPSTCERLYTALPPLTSPLARHLGPHCSPSDR